MAQKILIAGATGNLGRHLGRAFTKAGWIVHALVRDVARAKSLTLEAQHLVEAQATDIKSLQGAMTGMDVVISALGSIRQTGETTYYDVDFKANLNLLKAAEAARVSRFAYIHILNASKMMDVDLVCAKQYFVDRLQASKLASTIIAPSRSFSDMRDLLELARTGRVYLHGDGEFRMNPIDGADLASFAVKAVEQSVEFASVGGPDVLTQNQVIEMAFHVLGKSPRITHLPPLIGQLAIKFMRRATSQPTYGPIEYFITVMGMDMIGEATGTRHLAYHFATLKKQSNRSA